MFDHVWCGCEKNRWDPGHGKPMGNFSESTLPWTLGTRNRGNVEVWKWHQKIGKVHRSTVLGTMWYQCGTMHSFAKKDTQTGSAQPQDPALCRSDQPQACTGLRELKGIIKPEHLSESWGVAWARSLPVFHLKACGRARHDISSWCSMKFYFAGGWMPHHGFQYSKNLRFGIAHVVTSYLFMNDQCLPIWKLHSRPFHKLNQKWEPSQGDFWRGWCKRCVDIPWPMQRWSRKLGAFSFAAGVQHGGAWWSCHWCELLGLSLRFMMYDFVIFLVWQSLRAAFFLSLSPSLCLFPLWTFEAASCSNHCHWPLQDILRQRSRILYAFSSTYQYTHYTYPGRYHTYTCMYS